MGRSNNAIGSVAREERREPCSGRWAFLTRPDEQNRSNVQKRSRNERRKLWEVVHIRLSHVVDLLPQILIDRIEQRYAKQTKHDQSTHSLTPNSHVSERLPYLEHPQARQTHHRPYRVYADPSRPGEGHGDASDRFI